ncbi:aryl-sulfate sulfotransferase [Winogradskyella sp. A3E31]|uniref:aryl-sulfate sulfotransferase n=1 Tax=Winogradskyella sp. A3E31 TaxID=3349637 RepID=UPI00398B7D5C
MNRKLLTLLSINLFFSFALAQNTVGTIINTEDAAPGYTLFTASTETYLINNCGEVINQWSSVYPPGNAVYLLEDGSILRAGRTSSGDITFGGQGGIVEKFDWDGNLTWQYLYDTPQMRQHHDVYPMPNGNVLILAATVMSNAEAIQAGRNPSLLPESDLYNEQVIEVTPSGLNGAIVVWEWNINDHLIQDFDATKDNFGDVGLSQGKLDINFLNGGSGGSNWLHMNSVQYNEALDQIILSSRNLSEIYIIDHSTTSLEAASSSGGTYGNGGDFLYRWGNPQSYRHGDETDRLLYGQHYPYIIEDGLIDAGKMILFNNGNGRTPLFSDVYVFTLPESSPGFYNYTANTAYAPLAPDYIYNTPTPTDFYSSILSSAQRLPNGNTLICEGFNGRFFEIDQLENKVWEYISPVNNNNGDIASQGDDPGGIANLSFRAIKYPLDYPAFDSRDLTPDDPIEDNSSMNVACTTLSTNQNESHTVSIYPNPTQSVININTRFDIDKIEIYNIIGAKIAETYSASFDLSQYKNGVYFLNIYLNGNQISKKIIKY